MSPTFTLPMHPKNNPKSAETVETPEAEPDVATETDTDHLSAGTSATRKWPYKVYYSTTSLEGEPDDEGDDLFEGLGEEEYGIAILGQIVDLIPECLAEVVLRSDGSEEYGGNEVSDNKSNNDMENDDDDEFRHVPGGTYAVSINRNTGLIIMVHESLSTPNAEGFAPTLMSESKNCFITQIVLDSEVPRADEASSPESEISEA